MISDNGVRFFEYDIDANKWTRKKDQASGRPNGIFFSHSGKLYYGLGGSGVSYTQSENAKLGILWEYAPATDSWEKVSDMPLDWLRGSVIGYGIVDNKLFLSYSNGVSGGEDGANKLQSTMLYQYDFTTKQWSEKTRMPDYLFNWYSFATGGSIADRYYFYGSIRPLLIYNPVFEHPNRLFAYSPQTDRWKEVKSSPQPYTNEMATVLTIFTGNGLYVGYQNPNPYASKDYSSKWWVYRP